MAEEEHIYYKERSVTISNRRAVFGHRAFDMEDIQEASVRTLKPRRNLFYLLLVIGAMVFAYVTFQNLFGVLLLLILFSPILIGSLTAKSPYALELLTGLGDSQPLVSYDADEIREIAEVVNQACREVRQRAGGMTPQGEKITYSPPGTEGEFIRHVSKNCKKCGQQFTDDKIIWSDPGSGVCAQCGANVEITWRRAG
jgi:hypothetical protein